MNTFEVHKLEHIKVLIGESKSENRSGIIMRLECDTEDTKDGWVKAINNEVKQLRSMKKSRHSRISRGICEFTTMSSFL